jgi:hypothetical protein
MDVRVARVGEVLGSVGVASAIPCVAHIDTCGEVDLTSVGCAAREEVGTLAEE